MLSISIKTSSSTASCRKLPAFPTPSLYVSTIRPVIASLRCLQRRTVADTGIPKLSPSPWDSSSLPWSHLPSNLAESMAVSLLSRDGRSSRPSILKTRSQMPSLTWSRWRRSRDWWCRSRNKSRPSWQETSLTELLRRWRKSRPSCSTWASLLISQLKCQRTPLARASIRRWLRRLRSSWQPSSTSLVE